MFSEDSVGQLPAAFRTPRGCSNAALRIIPASSGRPYLQVLTCQHLGHLAVGRVGRYVKDRPVLGAPVKAERERPFEGTSVRRLIMSLVRLNRFCVNRHAQSESRSRGRDEPRNAGRRLVIQRRLTVPISPNIRPTNRDPRRETIAIKVETAGLHLRRSYLQ